MSPEEFKNNIARESFFLDVIVIFLRHLGCIYTLEILEKVNSFLAKNIPVKIYCVHPGTKTESQKIYALLGNSEDVEIIEDFNRNLFRYFSVRQATLPEFFSSLRHIPLSMAKFLRALKNFSFNRDIFQLPGAMLIRRGRFYKHQSATFFDIPPLEQLLCLNHANDR